MKSKSKRPRLNLLSPLRRFSGDQLTFITLLVLLVGTGFVYFALAASPGEYGSIEQDQLNRINSARASYGVGPQTYLYSSDCIRKFAYQWSVYMAQQGYISHNPYLGASMNGCGNWYNAGENVGVVSVTDTASASLAIFNAFMASTGHKANILSTSYDHVGVGAYIDGSNRLWITQDFVECTYPPGYCGGTWAQAQNFPSDPVNTSHNPIGNIDSANCSTISGWTFDPDASSSSIQVHIYMSDGIGYPITTNLLRSDVNNAYHISGYHGFSWAVPAKYRDGRSHTATIYYINTGLGTNTVTQRKICP